MYTDWYIWKGGGGEERLYGLYFFLVMKPIIFFFITCPQSFIINLNGQSCTISSECKTFDFVIFKNVLFFVI